MRIVIVSNCNVLYRHVIESVIQRYQVEAVVKPIWEPAQSVEHRRPFSVSRVFRSFKLRMQDRYFAWLERRLEQAAKPILLTGDRLPAQLVTEVSTENFNSFRTAEILANTKPDVVLVMGAPIINSGLLRTIEAAWINVHYGITPDYRGEHTIFWPLLNRDYSSVGVTLHHITSRIDLGPVLARGYPQLAAGDTEVSVQLRCAQLAAKLTLDFLDGVVQTGVIPAGKEQNSAAAAPLRYRARQPWHELQYKLGSLVRGSKVPSRPELIEKYYDTQEEKIVSGF